MRSRWRFALPALLALTMAVSALPAGAHDPHDDEHPGDGAGGINRHSKNMHLLANLPRSSDQRQSDLAFQGNYLFSGNYNGARIVDISEPGSPTVVRDLWCPGPQNDISVYGDLMILSVDEVRTSSSCTSSTMVPQTNPAGWEGIRIFSISEILAATPGPDGFVRVEPIAAPATDCGSHTHTLYPDAGNDRLVIYISSYSLRSGPRCGPENANQFGYDPLHGKIGIVNVPLGDPSAFEVTYAPIDAPVWNLISGPGFNPMRACHDIQVDTQQKLAAGACASEGQVWDISDPLNPDTANPLWTVDEPEVQFYHSALFSSDRETVIFGDEIVQGTCGQGNGAGQLWFHDADTGATLSSFDINRDQGGAYCSAHLFNNIPGTRRDVLVASWYSAGVEVVDFTDPANPREVGFYDPADTDTQVNRTWTAYWYNNFIYTNDGSTAIGRGTDVLRLSDKAAAGADRLPMLNAQTQ